MKKMATSLNDAGAARIYYDEVLAKYTSWRVGGKADCLYFPADREDLVHFLGNIDAQMPVFWMGMGSNLLIRDGGIRGTVINTRGCLKTMQLTAANTVYVEAGVQCARVARFCGDNGLGGAEFLAGIPGTMGGALSMNAGAFGSETWGIVKSVDIIDNTGDCHSYNPDQYDIAYRSVKSHAEQQGFLATHLQLTTGDTKESQMKVKGLLATRAQTQPLNQSSCGSVFRNPEGDFAARLIEASNLKGYTIGGACVSNKHANFIVNVNKSSATDIERLIKFVQEQVQLLQGVSLQMEVCIVGERL